MKPDDDGQTEPPASRQSEAMTTSAKAISPAARRALAEAEERRRMSEAAGEKPVREIGGRGGKDPARYGDWEVKGLAVDF